jgi:hypothetical protein
VDLSRAWTAFGGASLTLMGAALAAGARRHAADNAAWQRQWSQAVGAPASVAEEAKLVRGYRAAGAACALLGLGFAAASAFGRALVSPRFTGGDPRLGGAGLAALGLGFGAVKLRVAFARAPRFLYDAASKRPLDERLAGLATWALCALRVVFGFQLISEGMK